LSEPVAVPLAPTLIAARPRWITLLAASVWLVTLGVGLATLWTLLATDSFQVMTASYGVTPTSDFVLAFQAAMIAFFAITMGYATVGALLAGRGTAGLIASLLLAGGLLFALIPFGFVVGGRLVVADPGSAVYRALFLLGPVAIGPGFATILPGLAIFFPDGRLPSSRWRWSVGIASIAIAIGTFLQIMRPGPIGGSGNALNPFGVDALPAEAGALAEAAVGIGLLAITVLGVGAVIVRYRRGDAIERQQQRWFVVAVSLAAVPFVLTVLPWTGGPEMGLFAAVGLFLVPIAVGIAVTRYHLYEIDHLISRTLVYVPLTALLAGLYAATVTLFQKVFQSLTGNSSDAAIILSTLVLASVFTPLRKWLEGLVERRFKPASAVVAGGILTLSEVAAAEWEDRVAAVALRVVRSELDARASDRSTAPLD